MRLIQWLLLCFVLGYLNAGWAESVRVGGYVFPPYVMMEDGQPRGLTLDVIDALNALQAEDQFQFFLTSSRRRYRDLAEKHYDMLLFEDLRWEWDQRPVTATRVIGRDQEVFLAYRDRARGQSFFNDLKDKRLVGMLGYHYAFANYVADQAFLDTQFNILLSSDPHRNLQLILVNRPSVAEVAVMPRSFINCFIREHPEVGEKLLVSDRVDQRYKLRGLLAPHAPISSQRLNTLLARLEEQGTLAKLRERYGLVPLQEE
ncbi:ABC transporter substrate-binding protein [Marinobacteraceae bacterium S3BR75-40.1]